MGDVLTSLLMPYTVLSPLSSFICDWSYIAIVGLQ